MYGVYSGKKRGGSICSFKISANVFERLGFFKIILKSLSYLTESNGAEAEGVVLVTGGFVPGACSCIPTYGLRLFY